MNKQNGEARKWSYGDDDLFDEDEKICDACGGPFVIGQVIQERPAFSLRFYHVDTKDCD
jgi:hypothetical protein